MNTTQTNSHRRGEQISAPKATQIKLGIDVHARVYVVVRQLDGQNPQPPQKFSAVQFREWAREQTTLATQVFSCYEAGAFGYGLHRDLLALGVRNVVICPQELDERHTGVKTDQTDARALVLKLDQYVRGNPYALAVVRVPTVEEEQRRALGRQREQFRDERRRLEAQGRSLLLSQGRRLKGRWWKPRPWQAFSVSAPPAWVVEQLRRLRRLVVAVDEELQALTRQLEQTAPQQRPVGLGGLTHALIEREVCDWTRFQNRRQVGSYLGLCPREASSGGHRRLGSITKHGNPRLRVWLVELVWRLVRFQPQYVALRRWGPLLSDPRASAARRKKAIVAVARRLGVDLWRMATGRVTAAQLGLELRTSGSGPTTA
jgi:transposase